LIYAGGIPGVSALSAFYVLKERLGIDKSISRKSSCSEWHNYSRPHPDKEGQSPYREEGRQYTPLSPEEIPPLSWRQLLDPAHRKS
jgi:hypothetical protein